MVNEIQLLSKHMTTSLGRQQRNEKEKNIYIFSNIDASVNRLDIWNISLQKR